MTLHVMNKTLQHKALYDNMINAVSEGDTVLLIEDAVYSALTAHESLYSTLPVNVELRVLQADSQARGVEAKLSPLFKVINDQGFVRLSCEHPKVVSWY